MTGNTFACRRSRAGALLLPAIVTVVGSALVFGLETFQLVQLSLWVIYGLLALSLDLVWGYAGIFSFGQSAFFGLAGYTYGAIAINLVSTTGESLTALAGAVVVGAAAAALLGYFMFYGRVGDVYLAIITLAVTLVLLTFFGSTADPKYAIGEAHLGGYNGMIGIPPLTIGFPGVGSRELTIEQTYVFVVVAAGAVYALLRLLQRTPFGRILAAVRENEQRTELLGYDVRWYKLLAFTLGGGIAGLAGALYAAWGMFINPAVFSLAQTASVVIWLLVGGRGTMVDAFLGAAVVEGLSTGIGKLTQHTTLVVGIILILMVLLLPNGLMPLLRTGWDRVRRTRRAEPLAPVHGARQGGSQRASIPVADPGTPVLQTTSLSISFGGLVALSDVSLDFPQGLHCLIGPNGAGKSTFFNLLVGRYQPTSGRILYRGRDITRLQPHERARLGIGIKLQVASIYDQLTVAENVWLAAYAHLRAEGPATVRAWAVLERINLWERAGELAAHLSHGEQQRLEIGMVLAATPDLILLDEPTAGMTREETRSMAQLISELARTCTVVVVEHDMEFVRDLNAPVTVLHQGKVFARGSLDQLRQDEAVLDIYLGRRVHAGA